MKTNFSSKTAVAVFARQRISMTLQARLLLEDGTEFFGRYFTEVSDVFGEVVFNTAMSEYLSAPINIASVISPSLNSTKTDEAFVNM